MLHITSSDISRLLPRRERDSHKGNYGKILLLCGSRGYTGAAALAAMGALRTGAGLVYSAVPESIYAIEAVKLTEPVVMPLADEQGMVSQKAIPRIREMLPKMDAVLFGCGSGLGEGPEEVLKLLKQYDVKQCCYGHLHGPSHRLAVRGTAEGMEFTMVSADYLSFSPKKIAD